MSADIGAHRAPGPLDRVGQSEPGGQPTLTSEGEDPSRDLPGGGPGSTRIADKVVERIAQHTVDGLDRATGSSRRLLGLKVGSLNEDTPARVDATVDGDLAMVKVSMAVRWPESVRQVTRQAREEITREVTRWTGLRVAHIDIAVPELLTVKPGGDR